MFKNIALLALTLFVSVEFSPVIFAQGGSPTSGDSNPIMVIRCRFQNSTPQEALTDTKQDSKTIDTRVIDECSESTNLQPITFPNGNGECIPICFDGAVQMSFPAIDCSTATAGVFIETEVCFTSASTVPLEVGQYVAFDAIANCLDDGGNSWLLDFLSNNPAYNPTYDEAGFGPAADVGGTVQICATFHVDPARFVQANVISETNPTGTLVSTAPCPSLAIPTMGQWGLLILGLLTSCIALSFLLIGSRKLA